MFKAHSAGHPLKGRGTQGVREHTWNITNGTPGRGGGVRKTYKTQKEKENPHLAGFHLRCSPLAGVPFLHDLLLVLFVEGFFLGTL